MVALSQAPCSTTPSLLTHSGEQGRDEHTCSGDCGQTGRGVHFQRRTLGCGEPFGFLSPNHFPYWLSAAHTTVGSSQSSLPAPLPLPRSSQGKHVTTCCSETI